MQKSEIWRSDAVLGLGKRVTSAKTNFSVPSPKAAPMMQNFWGLNVDFPAKGSSHCSV